MKGDGEKLTEVWWDNGGRQSTAGRVALTPSRFLRARPGGADGSFWGWEVGSRPWQRPTGAAAWCQPWTRGNQVGGYRAGDLAERPPEFGPQAPAWKA